MVVFLENPHEPTDQLMELIKELSKLTRYTINILKTIAQHWQQPMKTIYGIKNH
jgi:hypothetical protein